MAIVFCMKHRCNLHSEGNTCDYQGNQADHKTHIHTYPSFRYESPSEKGAKPSADGFQEKRRATATVMVIRCRIPCGKSIAYEK